MNDFDALINYSMEDITKLYLDENDKRDWVVAWSGGKDSSCLLGMVVAALESLPVEERKRKIWAIMSDTQMENPNLDFYMKDQVNKINEFAKKNNLPLSGEIVKRIPEHSYFYLVLGKGYFLPQNNGKGRWCTQRLKILPQDKRIREIDPSYILLGVRTGESSKRKESIEKWSNKNDLSYKIGEHVHIKSSKTFMPIVDFSIEDVWGYLQQKSLPWSSTHMVRKLYRDATGECGFTNPKKTEKKSSTLESCGARFGCWTCPVILKDRSTEEMSKNNSWMKPLSEFRMMQLRVMGDYKPTRPKNQSRKDRSKILRAFEGINNQIKQVTKSGYKMNGKRMIDKKGKERDDQGTVTIEARKFLFEELMKTQSEVNELRLSSGINPIELISEEEVKMIKKRWQEDEIEKPWLITNAQGINIKKLEELIITQKDLEKNQ